MAVTSDLPGTTATPVTPVQPTRAGVSGVVAIAGVGITILGLMMMLERAKFAAALFGANFLFGMPMTREDAGKMLMTGYAGFGMMAIGIITIIGSIAAVVMVSARRS